MKGAGILFCFREVRCRFWYRKNPIDSRKKGRTTLRCILYRNYNLYSAYLAILSGALLGSRKRWSPSWLVSFRRFPPFSHWIPLGAIHGSSKRYCCSALKLLYQQTLLLQKTNIKLSNTPSSPPWATPTWMRQGCMSENWTETRGTQRQCPHKYI